MNDQKEKAPGREREKTNVKLAFSSKLQTCRYCNSKSLAGFYFCPYCGLNQDVSINYSQEDIEKAKLVAMNNYLASSEREQESSYQCECLSDSKCEKNLKNFRG